MRILNRILAAVEEVKKPVMNPEACRTGTVPKLLLSEENGSVSSRHICLNPVTINTNDNIKKF